MCIRDREKQLPELDDDFVKDVSEFDTLDELKADIRARLMERAEAKCEEDYENGLVSAVLENTVIDLPQCMIDTRIDEMVQDFDYRLRSQGLDLNTYFQYTGETLPAMRKTFAEQAERHVRIRLALEKIAELEGLTATHEDVDKEIAKIAEMYHMDEKEVRENMPLNALSQDIVVNKAIELIKANAVAEPVSYTHLWTAIRTPGWDFPPKRSSRGTDSPRPLRQLPFWRRYPGTAICWNWISSIRSMISKSTRAIPPRSTMSG